MAVTLTSVWISEEIKIWRVVLYDLYEVQARERAARSGWRLLGDEQRRDSSAIYHCVARYLV